MAILPIKGTTSQINNTPILDGQILFETDNGDGQNHMYIDVDSYRLPVGIYDWSHIENKPFTSIGAGLSVTNGVLNLDSTISVDWDDVTLKPFNTIGNGLYVSSNALKAKIENVAFGWIGSASASSARWQQMVYVNEGATYTNEIGGSKYMQYSQTLSTSANTVYTFTSDIITTDSIIDVYTSIFGATPIDISISTGSCTITFPPYANANTNMLCRIYFK